MMVVGKDDLGLNLTLGLSSNDLPPVTHHTNLRNHSSLQLNLMIPALTSPTSAPVTVTPPAPAVSSQFPIQKKLWNSDLFPPTDLNSDPCIASNQQPYLRGIDVNRLPASTAPAPADEDDAGVSSPNSTLSSVSGKRIERDPISDDQDGERACSRSGGSDEEDGGDGSRKKLRLSKDQSAILEESFKEHNTLNPKQKLALAKRLGLRPRQVEVWFQNRRARTKLKQTEVDCEFLKRCCDQLTEENRRLQKEVAELRALKLSPQFYMQMTPPTTLTMCPSCERVAAPPSSSTAAAAPSQGPPVRNHRPVPVNPWLSTPVPVRPFEALRPRS